MARVAVVILTAWIGLVGLAGPAPAAPPGPTDLNRSIETARAAIAGHERTLREYDDEMRRTVANDPASARRREEIRIIKRYYNQEIEALTARIIDDYKKLREYRTRGAQ